MHARLPRLTSLLLAVLLGSGAGSIGLPLRVAAVETAPAAAPVVGPAADPSDPAGTPGDPHPLGFVRTPNIATGIKARATNLMASIESYPASVDLSQWAPPVGNQGGVGSCTSWATGYYLRYWLRNKAMGEQTLLAPMFLYSQIVKGVNTGTSFPSNFNILDNQGIAPQSAYTQGNYDYTTQPTADEVAAAAPYKASSYAMLFSGANTANQTAIQAAMATGVPVVVAIPVYPEFDRVNSANGWLVTAPTAGETSRGGHALFGVKYDANGLWVENSWGTYWGNAGWAELSWDFLNRYAWEGWTLSATGDNPNIASISTFTPNRGTAGTQVTITGTKLTGATSVTFGTGSASSFTVTSDTQITATVPATATTGTVSVTTPAGTATSAASFTLVGAPKVNSVAASTSSIKYDPNGYCPTATVASTITAKTAISATTATATSVVLNLTRPDGTTATLPMTKTATTATDATWTATISTATDRALKAGTARYTVTATGSGTSTTYPSSPASLAIAACANTAPTITLASASTTTAYTNPLGTGSVPAGVAGSITFWGTATDTDGVASASVTLTGAGLATPLVVPMTKVSGTWTATVNPTTAKIPGGTLAWKLSVKDALGAEASKAGTSITIVRADTAGAVAFQGTSGTNASQTALVTASDPDATVATTSNLKVTASWTATYRNRATGLLTTTTPATVAATWVSGNTYKALIATPWLTTAVDNARITLLPFATDPFKGVSQGTSTTFQLNATGAATITSSSTNLTAVATDPLGTGTHTLPDTVTFTAAVYDTDAITRVAVSYTGPGLATARELVLVPKGDGVTWTGTLDVSASGVTGTGNITWKVLATDAASNVATSAAKTLKVTRADTAGTVAVTGYTYDASGNVVVAIAATDPDATVGTTTNLVVTLGWSGTIGTTSYTSKTATAAYAGNGTWRATLAVGTALTTARTGSFSWTPKATDPYKYVTTGTSSSQTVAAAS